MQLVKMFVCLFVCLFVFNDIPVVFQESVVDKDLSEFSRLTC